MPGLEGAYQASQRGDPLKILKPRLIVVDLDNAGLGLASPVSAREDLVREPPLKLPVGEPLVEAQCLEERRVAQI